MNSMNKTKNIYTLIVLAISVVILCGVFFLVFHMGGLKESSENEAVAIDRLHEITEKYEAKMDQNIIIVQETKAAIDSLLVQDEKQFIIEQDQIAKSRILISRIPKMPNDTLQKLYTLSWNYLLNEYRSGRLQPAE